MTVTVGRIRACPILGIKFVALGHNTIRGAAGAAVLNAELMLADGWLERTDAAAGDEVRRNVGRRCLRRSHASSESSGNAAGSGPSVVVVSAMSRVTDELLRRPSSRGRET